MADYLITDTQMTAIADAVRNMRYEDEKMTPAQMITKIQSSTLGIPLSMKGRVEDSHLDNNGHWIRPEGYPDLDVLYETIGDTESCIYLTYDLTKTPGYGWIGIYASGSSYYVSRGHIADGTFVSDYTSDSINAGSCFRQTLDDANGNIQLWKVYSSGNLVNVKFATSTTTTATSYMNNLQPCVERVGKLPYVTHIGSSNSVTATYYTFSTQWLERDRIMVGTKSSITSLNGMYAAARSLRETNCEEWDTSNWNIANIGSMFNECYHLQKLDLSHWDTSKWVVTTASTIFQNCFSLKYLNVSTWDTSKWHPSNLEYMFYGCHSLVELDLSHWDVSNWTVTSLRSTFGYCLSLKKLDVSTWDTSGWSLTNLGSTWYCDYSLLSLPIDNWNTSNWEVTTMSYTWSNCRSLTTLDLSSWDVSNWRPQTLIATWAACQSLKELPIDDWDVSDWELTSLESAWSGCQSLKSLNLNKWDVSKWRPTSCASIFGTCFSLKTLKIDNWDVSNWPVTDFSRCFNDCRSLKEIDLTSWNVSGWAVTTIYYLFYDLCNANKVDIHNWDVSNWALTEARYLYSGSYINTLLLPAGLHGTVTNSKFTSNISTLINFHGPSLDINQNYSNSQRLTHESLVTLINELPTVSSTKTLTIGQTNKLKLTAAEIAVATQKGWTVA